MNLVARLEGLVTTAELAARPDFALGGSVVSPSARTVTGPGGKVDVEPRVMQVLVVLADAKGAVVTRDTLFRRCWGSPAVTDDSLNRAIGSLRRIAGSIADSTFEVETIPRTGYRLVAENSSADVIPQRPVSRRRFIAAGVAGGAIGAGILGYNLLGRDEGNPRVAELVARSDLAARNGSLGGDAQAVRLLEEAVAAEPSSALAWGRLALARCLMSEQAPPAQTAALVAGTQEAAERAVAIDRRQPDALAALALLPPYYGDWAAADERMTSVLEVDAGHLATLDARGFMRAGAGRAVEASAERMRYAVRAPLHVGHQFKVIYSNWILGDIAAADRAADRALNLWPKHKGVWFARLWTLAFTQRADRALAHVDDAAGRPDLPTPVVNMLRSSMTALAGRRPGDVATAVASVMSLLSDGPSHSINAVMILSGLGEIDAAFDVASAYLLERGPVMAAVRWRPGQMSVDNQRRRKTNMLFVPVTAPMRADPRFMKLVTDIGLTGYWDRMRVTPDFLSRRR